MKLRVVFILFTFLLINQPTLYSGEIRLTTQEWPHYQYYQNGVLQGEAVDVVRCVMDKMGWEYDIEVLPWKRAQMYVKNGRADGFFAASRNDSRDKYATISSFTNDQKWNWYLNKDYPLLPTDKEFRAKSVVSANAGSNMMNWLEKNGYRIKAESYTTEPLVRLLIRKRIDALLGSESVVNNILKEKKIPKSYFRIITNRDKPLGVYFSNMFLVKNPGFLNEFNSYVEGCRKKR